NDGHYFCGAGGNRPDGLNEPVTNHLNGSENSKQMAIFRNGKGRESDLFLLQLQSIFLRSGFRIIAVPARRQF
ncbi:hypothetical protein, partial [Escherichia marmotae]|uniref:hypothetical protein n=1 Tax=Escherichia marmotae TaxID=1499973 RepID=UPI000907B322